MLFLSWEIVSFVELCSDPFYKSPDADTAKKSRGWYRPDPVGIGSGFSGRYWGTVPRPPIPVVPGSHHGLRRGLTGEFWGILVNIRVLLVYFELIYTRFCIFVGNYVPLANPGIIPIPRPCRRDQSRIPKRASGRYGTNLYKNRINLLNSPFSPFGIWG